MTFTLIVVLTMILKLLLSTPGMCNRKEELKAQQ